MPEPSLWLTTEQSVDALNRIPTEDPEVAHALADEIMRASVSLEVRNAYDQLRQRCPWWRHS